jgi:hypothetical protein
LLRPSIIGASWREPVPGWVDNVSAAGSVFLTVGLGISTLLQGQPTGIGDLIPVDMVVSHVLASAVAISGRTGSLEIVHSTTSTLNPMKWRVACTVVPEYWRKHPPQNRVRDTRWSMVPHDQSFRLRWWLEYDLPSMAYDRFALATGSDRHRKQAAQLKRLTTASRQVLYYVEVC